MQFFDINTSALRTSSYLLVQSIEKLLPQRYESIHNSESWIINCAAASCQRNVKQESNDCGTATHDDSILNNSEHCSTSRPFRRHGERVAVDWNNSGRSTECNRVHNVHFLSLHTKSRTCNYESLWRVDFHIIQMLIQSKGTERKKCREKPRFWNKSRTRLARK